MATCAHTILSICPQSPFFILIPATFCLCAICARHARFSVLLPSPGLPLCTTGWLYGVYCRALVWRTRGMVLAGFWERNGWFLRTRIFLCFGLVGYGHSANCWALLYATEKVACLFLQLQLCVTEKEKNFGLQKRKTHTLKHIILVRTACSGRTGRVPYLHSTHCIFYATMPTDIHWRLQFLNLTTYYLSLS